MFQAAALIIPEGDFLSTWGEVTPGGIAGLNRFSKLGFTLTGIRQVMDTNDNVYMLKMQPIDIFLP